MSNFVLKVLDKMICYSHVDVGVERRCNALVHHHCFLQQQQVRLCPHAVRQIEKLRASDAELDADIRLLTRQLEG